MQENWYKNSNFFDRLAIICASKGLKNVNELSEKLNYESAEKLYRLKRNTQASPSYQILFDLANLFEDLNMRWLITGIGEPFINFAQVNEPSMEYGLQKQCERLKIENETLMRALKEVSKK